MIRRSICNAALAALFMSADAQTVITNSRDAQWKRDKGDPPGSETVMLREDKDSGSVEFFTRYPAGFQFQSHWHTANERIILLEGRLTVRVGDKEQTLDPGGFAFFPSKQAHQISCSSATRCAFYLYWDAKPDFHK